MKVPIRFTLHHGLEGHQLVRAALGGGALRPADAGAAHAHPQAAVRRRGLGDRGAHLLLVGHVARHERRALAELVRERRALLLVQVGDRHDGAARVQRPRRRLAEARRAARHDRSCALWSHSGEPYKLVGDAPARRPVSGSARRGSRRRGRALGSMARRPPGGGLHAPLRVTILPRAARPVGRAPRGAPGGGGGRRRDLPVPRRADLPLLPQARRAVRLPRRPRARGIPRRRARARPGEGVHRSRSW